MTAPEYDGPLPGDDEDFDRRTQDLLNAVFASGCADEHSSASPSAARASARALRPGRDETEAIVHAAGHSAAAAVRAKGKTGSDEGADSAA